MSRWRARGFLLLGPALALASTPHSSFAAEPSKTELAAARDLFSRAEHDEDGGRWPDALDKLRRAGTVKMTPGIRFHIALCEEKLGQLLAALADYNAAEAAARSEGNKDVLDAVADPLAALRGRVPTLIITTPVDVKDAAVTLDGSPLATGLLGTAVPVDVGPHTIQARAVGRQPFGASVSVVEKQALTVEVRMPSAAVAVGPAKVAAGPAAPAGPTGSPLEPAPGGTSAQPSSPKTAAIVTTAGAAALVGFGVAAYFVSGGQQSAAETQCARDLPPACDDLKGGVRTWDALALGAWIAGAGVGALSVYLWTRPSGPSEKPAQAALRIGPGAIQLNGEF